VFDDFFETIILVASYSEYLENANCLLQVMKDLGHENMVRYYTAFHEKSVSYLALEFVGGGGAYLQLPANKLI
jgi:serine/threonine protein kinase